jgi:DNA-binding XRE family transcriptional regulator
MTFDEFKIGPARRVVKRFKTIPSAVVKTLARNVRRHRIALGWTQEELAWKCKIEQQAISLLENARSNPTVLMCVPPGCYESPYFTGLFGFCYVF